MVRAHMKQSTEEKKETPRKAGRPRIKSPITGIWHCKINGCTKQFAREADLKRHQRTTKLHSMPGFACPQCDATFTRTDALRRHQKSRHNGVIIDPMDSGGDDGNPEGGPSSDQGSRSGSPSALGKEKKPSSSSSQSAGSSRYYRQHTRTNGGPYVSPRPPVGPALDSHFSHSVALPTSATRLHQANWTPSAPPPPPWAAEISPVVGPLSYQQLPPATQYFQVSPYYRADPVPLNPSLLHPQTNSGQPAHSQNGLHSATNGTSELDGTKATGAAESTSNDSHRTSSKQSSIAVVNSAAPAPSVIDPSLANASAPEAHRLKDSQNVAQFAPQQPVTAVAPNALSLTITHAAMNAVLGPSRQASSGKPNLTISRSLESTQIDDLDADGELDGDDDEERVIENHLTTASSEGYTTSLAVAAFTRPEPMEHMLTEDGEPMLNPAELLTQESLASPPPS